MGRARIVAIHVAGVAVVAHAVGAWGQLLPNDYLVGYRIGIAKTASPPGTPFPKGVTRTIVDPGSSTTCTIAKEKSVYTPTDFDVPAQNPERHYVAYQVKCVPAPGTEATYVDAFFPGGIFITGLKPSHLLVPSGKDLTLTPDPTPPAAGTNHYLCRKPKVHKISTLTVLADDQFGSHPLTIKKVRSVCSPADKDGDDPSAPTDVDHYVCYAVKASKPTPVTMRTNNLNFGANTLVTKKISEFCAPAYDSANPPTTTTTAPPTTTTTTITTTTTEPTTTTTSTSTTTTTTEPPTTTTTSTTTTTTTTTSTTLPCPFVLAFGSFGTGNGQFNDTRLNGITVDGSGNVYTVEDGGGANNRVQKFDNNGNFLLTWGGAGSGDGQFGDPQDIAADASGNVYVSDILHRRIQKFDSSGNFLLKWGSAGNPFFDITAVAVNPSDGTVVVAENVGGEGRFHRFTATGTLINSWNTLPQYLGVNHDSLAVDAAGNVIFASGNNVYVFTSTGTQVTQWGGFGTGDGQFDTARGLARSSGGDVFVANASFGFSGLPRIQRFTSTGTFVAKWGSIGTGPGQFSWNSQWPAIAVDASNNVFFADGGNSRVQKFACP